VIQLRVGGSCRYSCSWQPNNVPISEAQGQSRPKCARAVALCNNRVTQPLWGHLQTKPGTIKTQRMTEAPRKPTWIQLRPRSPKPQLPSSNATAAHNILSAEKSRNLVITQLQPLYPIVSSRPQPARRPVKGEHSSP
jgi:hypothetical protein